MNEVKRALEAKGLEVEKTKVTDSFAVYKHVEADGYKHRLFIGTFRTQKDGKFAAGRNVHFIQDMTADEAIDFLS